MFRYWWVTVPLTGYNTVTTVVIQATGKLMSVCTVYHCNFGFFFSIIVYQWVLGSGCRHAVVCRVSCEHISVFMWYFVESRYEIIPWIRKWHLGVLLQPLAVCSRTLVIIIFLMIMMILTRKMVTYKDADTDDDDDEDCDFECLISISRSLNDVK